MEKVRENIVAQVAAGDSINSIATAFRVDRSTVWRAKKCYEETGEHSDRPREGHPRSTRTKSTILAMKKKIERNPVRSMNKMPKEHSVSQSTMSWIINSDLESKSRSVTRCQTLTDTNRAVRVERCQKMLNWLK